MKILRSNNGMTLVELIVSITIMGILIPTISASIFSTMKQYAWTKNYADMCGVISAIDGTVERELALASNLRLEDNAIVFLKNGTEKRRMETKEITFKGKNINILFINNTPVFDPKYYNNVDITASFSITEDDSVKVTIIYNNMVKYTSSFIVSKI